jgi:hypothetical protein
MKKTEGEKKLMKNMSKSSSRKEGVGGKRK